MTGGSGQLGQVYVAGLVERGMRVASFDLSSSTVPEALAHGVDITDRPPSSARSTASSELGVPRLLINNASLRLAARRPAMRGRAVRGYQGGVDAVMDVNVKGTFLCCQVVNG